MNASDKRLAELVLRRMCVGGHIDGIRFGPVLQILIAHTNHSNDEPIKGQVYLNLASSWKVFDSRPSSFPNGEEELPEISAEEEIREIIKLRERTIVDADLADHEPHLILTLDDGRIVFVNGKHERYECWQMGVAFSGDVWQVVACPGGDVAVWAPENFVLAG